MKKIKLINIINKFKSNFINFNNFKTNFKPLSISSSELLPPNIMIVGPSTLFSSFGYKMYYRSISGMANFNTNFKIFPTKLPIKNFHGRYMTIEQTFYNK